MSIYVFFPGMRFFCCFFLKFLLDLGQVTGTALAEDAPDLPPPVQVWAWSNKVKIQVWEWLFYSLIGRALVPFLSSFCVHLFQDQGRTTSACSTRDRCRSCRRRISGCQGSSRGWGWGTHQAHSAEAPGRPDGTFWNILHSECPKPTGLRVLSVNRCCPQCQATCFFLRVIELLKFSAGAKGSRSGRESLERRRAEEETGQWTHRRQLKDWRWSVTASFWDPLSLIKLMLDRRILGAQAKVNLNT